MPQGTLRVMLLAAACLAALTACKIVKTPEKGAAKSGVVESNFDNAAFDADRMAAEQWDAKILPYLEAKAGPFPEVVALAKADPDAAGAKYGHREKQDGSPWTLAVRLEGRIVAAQTQSRAGTVDVDADGDGQADATVQIGPALRGTALRDVLDFVSFGSFTNQIEYAQFGKALNSYVDRITLSALPRDALVGREVSVLGVYALGKGDAPPLVTPATLTLKDAP